MTDLHKAAEMALDALRLYVTMYPQMDKGYMVDARETLRQALAQPEQEPYFCKDCGKGLLGKEHIHTCSPQVKRQWVGLTDEEIKEAIAICKASWHAWAIDPIAFCNYVEAKLKEKNGV